MSQLEYNQSEHYRHERKFLITGYTAKDVEQFIRYNPACFREIYHQRTVNNIYFDSPGFASYYQNLDGDPHRTKYRIRWYGSPMGPVSGAVLELKIKNGLLGRKEYYPLSDFVIDRNFSKKQIGLALSSPGIPPYIKARLLALQPALLNTYSRKYFVSADKQFRLTIDQDLLFYRIGKYGNTFLNKAEFGNVVMELKYDVTQEGNVEEIVNGFPFPLTKNSKYLQGIERVLF